VKSYESGLSEEAMKLLPSKEERDIFYYKEDEWALDVEQRPTAKELYRLYVGSTDLFC